MVNFLKKRIWLYTSILLLITLIVGLGINVSDKPNHDDGFTIGNEQSSITFTIGNPVYASGTPDYVCDGTADDIQFQQAMNALPATGGRLVVLGGTYQFTATVTRVINNVTIEGVGTGTVINNNGVVDLFAIGGTNWVIRDLKVDAGSITNYTAATLTNVTIGTDLITYQTPSTSTASDFLVPVGRTATYVIAASDATALEKAQADVVCDGVADDVEINTAITTLTSGGLIHFTSGKFTLASAINDTTISNLTLEGCGGSTYFDCSAVVGVSGAINIRGAITAVNSLLTGNAVAYQSDIAVTDGTKFAIGNWIRIRSEAHWNSGTMHYGEIHKISNIVANTLTIEGILSLTYNVADTATVDKMTMLENITIKNIRFLGNYTDGWLGINIGQTVNAKTIGLNWSKAKYSAINFVDCVGVEASFNFIEKTNEAGLGYGIQTKNACRNADIHDNQFYDCRHSITSSGDDTYGVQFNLSWTNNISTYSAPGGVHANAVGSFTPHNNYQGLLISNNTVIGDGLGGAASINTVISNNTIMNDSCGHGGIYVGGKSSWVTIVGNSIIASGSSPTASGITFTDGGTVSHVIIEGNIIKGLGANSGAIYLRRTDITSLNIVNNDLYAETQISLWLNSIGTSSPASDITITNNKIQSDGTIALLISTNTTVGVDNVIISDNILRPKTNTVALSLFGSASTKLTNVQIHGNKIITAYYGINVHQSTDGVSIHDNEFVSCTTGIFIENLLLGTINTNIYNNRFVSVTTKVNSNVDCSIYGNIGYIASGEIRTYSKALSAGTVGNAVIAWQNPEGQAMMVTGRTRITTGASAASTGDWGLATTVQVVEDCEDAWTNGTHGTAAINTVYVERGTNCNAITITAGITNSDIVAYEDFAGKDISTATHLLFKFRSSVALNAADIAILLDEDAACASPSFTLNLPAIAANTTTTICLPINAGAAGGATVDALISVGLQVLNNTRAVAGTILYIDDIRAITVGTDLVNDANLQTLGIANYATPIHLDYKNNDDATHHDTLVMVSAANDSTGLVGSWYITGQGE